MFHTAEDILSPFRRVVRAYPRAIAGNKYCTVGKREDSASRTSSNFRNSATRLIPMFDPHGLSTITSRGLFSSAV